MNRKIIGIFVCTLLIATAVLPASGTLIFSEISYEKKPAIKEIFMDIERTEDKVLSVDEIIGNRQVKYWEHMVDDVLVKNDFILLHMDIENSDVLKYEKSWTDIELSVQGSVDKVIDLDNFFWKQLVVFPKKDDCRNFYTFDDLQEYPLVCREVRNTDGTTIIYNIDGKQIGQGIPTPSKGFSLSGYNDASWPDPWIEYRENADFWFAKWCTSTISLSLPTPSTISSHMRDSTVEYFYELAHGDEHYFQAETTGSNYYATTLKQDMTNRQSMKFAFLGSCHGMTSTCSGTFSYEFRKGQMTDTVTVGFDHMENCPGWEYGYYWQDSMFENMSKGLTIRESFDMATARYPTIEPAVVFLGDENLKIPLPDLECGGDISWTDVTPGDTITDSFTIENIGDPTSVLSWEIEDYPIWGTWEFTPSNGDDLTPEDGSVTVDVSVVAPEEKDKEFSGEVKIVNRYGADDYCTIHVSLATPKNKAINTIFRQFLEKQIHMFPLLRQLLELQ
jgi:hypothetical protein